MGRLAVYIAIDDSTLDAMWQLDDEPFRDRFLEIEEDGQFERLQIDKIWDVLHCTLTGVSASNPIEGNKLSEAIVGVYPKIYDDEDYTIFVSVIDTQDIEGILTALEKYDHSKLATLLDPEQLKTEKVYPHGIWEDDKDRLVAEMDTTLGEIRVFFRNAKNDKKHVLATIL